jgi:hypothetical protein
MQGLQQSLLNLACAVYKTTSHAKDGICSFVTRCNPCVVSHRMKLRSMLDVCLIRYIAGCQHLNCRSAKNSAVPE